MNDTLYPGRIEGFDLILHRTLGMCVVMCIATDKYQQEEVTIPLRFIEAFLQKRYVSSLGGTVGLFCRYQESAPIRLVEIWKECAVIWTAPDELTRLDVLDH